MTQTSSFGRDRYVIHMLHIECLELLAKLGQCKLIGQSTLSDGIFHTDTLKFVILFLDGLQLQTSFGFGLAGKNQNRIHPIM